MQPRANIVFPNNRAGFGLAGALLALSLIVGCTSETGERDALCSTTEPGAYPCQFLATDRNGSFEITAPGKPTYILNVDEPGVAYGFSNLGERNVSLPGQYLRSESDPACWLNTSTDTEICAR